MSPNRPHLSSLEFSIPAKAFLLGEYAVLGDAPALLVAVGPRFRLKVSPEGGIEGNIFRPVPESPAGLLIEWASRAGAPRLEFEFEDPFEGAGGFGASSAQFALIYLALAQHTDWPRHWQGPWKLYRELTGGEALPPSGADLVAQWQGGVTLFDPRERKARDLWPIFDFSSVLVFSASHQKGRKVATHEHLRKFSPAGSVFRALEEPLSRGMKAIQEDDPALLGQALDRYAEILHGAGLELPATTEDRRVLGKLPGVLGVKGAGALQADAIVVAMEKQSPHREGLIREAEGRGLRLLCDGIPCQKGVACEAG